MRCPSGRRRDEQALCSTTGRACNHRHAMHVAFDTREFPAEKVSDEAPERSVTQGRSRRAGALRRKDDTVRRAIGYA